MSTIIYPISDDTGQDIVSQLALIADNVSYTLPQATTTTLGGVTYDGVTLKKNDAGQLYVAYVDVSDQVEEMAGQIATLQSQVSVLQAKVRELSGETSTTEASVVDDQLVLDGASVVDDYLVVEGASVSDGYLTFGESSVSDGYVELADATVDEDGYVVLGSGTVSDDFIEI